MGSPVCPCGVAAPPVLLDPLETSGGPLRDALSEEEAIPGEYDLGRIVTWEHPLPDLPDVNPDFDLERLTPVEARFRHSGWAKRRRQVWDALGRLHVGGVARLRFACCGSGCWVQHSASRQRFRVSANLCRSRWCVPCGVARARRLLAAILPRIKGRDAAFHTLTLRHRDAPLREQLDKLLGDFNKLRRRPFWKQRVTGSAAFLEVKIGKDGKWHPHLHILSLGKPFPNSLLSREWKAVTGDSWIVDSKPITDPGQVASYVLKYVTKPLDSSLFANTDRLDEAIAALKGRRLVNASGDFGKINTEEPPDDGPDDWNTVGRLDRLFADAAAGDPVAMSVLEALWPRTSPAHERPAKSRPPPHHAS